MKKIVYLSLLFLSTFLLFSFTEESESGKPKSTCDASNSNSCVVIFADGTRVDATGVAKASQ